MSNGHSPRKRKTWNNTIIRLRAVAQLRFLITIATYRVMFAASLCFLRNSIVHWNNTPKKRRSFFLSFNASRRVQMMVFFCDARQLCRIYNIDRQAARQARNFISTVYVYTVYSAVDNFRAIMSTDVNFSSVTDNAFLFHFISHTIRQVENVEKKFRCRYDKITKLFIDTPSEHPPIH